MMNLFVPFCYRAARKASKILSEMRIGKKKAGAKRQRDSESQREFPEAKRNDSASSYSLEDVFTSRLTDSPPASRPSSPYQPRGGMQDNGSAFLPSELSRNIGVGGNDILSQSRIPALNPLMHTTMAMQVWANDALAVGSGSAHLQQDESKDQIDSKLAHSVPVAASLTDVFQDQYLPEENVARRDPRRDSSDESNRSH